MARARLLKPGFFSNETLTEIHPFGRLLFAGLWTIADREGRLVNRPKWIKGQLFPYENVPVLKHIKELEALGFINCYEVDGEAYIEIVNFTKHQHVHKNEVESEIPSFRESHTLVRTAPSIGESSTAKIESAPAEAEAEAEAVSKAKAEAGTTTETALARVVVHVPDPIDQIAADFGAFGKVTAGTARAIEEAVEDYSLEWVKLAVRFAAGAGFDGQPPWSYVEEPLKRWKKQGHPDEVIIDERKPVGRNAIAAPQVSDDAARDRALGLYDHGFRPVYVGDGGAEGGRPDALDTLDVAAGVANG